MEIKKNVFQGKHLKIHFLFHIFLLKLNENIFKKNRKRKKNVIYLKFLLFYQLLTKQKTTHQNKFKSEEIKPEKSEDVVPSSLKL